jgi:ribulose-phosphate 3-epimerase
MVQIIPAILSQTEEQFSQDLKNLLESDIDQTGWLHIDFMDNQFVHNLSIEPSVLKNFNIPYKKEAHLMVLQPLKWLDQLIELDFARIILHIEAEEAEKCLEYLKAKGIEVGLAIKAETGLDKLMPFLGKIDLVLNMSVEAGHQTNPFIKESEQKIQQIKKMREGNSFLISDDGGVDQSAKRLAEVGCDTLVIGSHLIKGNINENFKRISQTLQS